MRKELQSNQIAIPDTNSTLQVCFIGNFSDQDRWRVLNTVSKEIKGKTIYCNDLTGKEWTFDYKSNCGYWIENIEFTDALRKVKCTVCASSRGV